MGYQQTMAMLVITRGPSHSSMIFPCQPPLQSFKGTFQLAMFDSWGVSHQDESMVKYPLVNIQKTMENHHFKYVNQL